MDNVSRLSPQVSRCWGIGLAQFISIGFFHKPATRTLLNIPLDFFYVIRYTIKATQSELYVNTLKRAVCTSHIYQVAYPRHPQNTHQCDESSLFSIPSTFPGRLCKSLHSSLHSNFLSFYSFCFNVQDHWSTARSGSSFVHHVNSLNTLCARRAQRPQFDHTTLSPPLKCF